MAKNNRQLTFNVPKTVYMTEEMLQRIKLLAQQEDRSDAYVIRMLINLGLEVAPH